jgi:hypothetical protein
MRTCICNEIISIYMVYWEKIYLLKIDKLVITIYRAVEKATIKYIFNKIILHNCSLKFQKRDSMITFSGIL